MAENLTLKIAVSISLAIHLLCLGIVPSLFEDSKILRMPVRTVKVTILPMVATVAKEEPKGKITLPVPLSVGDQNRNGPASNQEGGHGETVFPLESMAKDIPSEEPRTSSQQPGEERTLKEPLNVIVAEELPSGSTLGKEENSVSPQETASDGGNQSISLPSLRSGESRGNGDGLFFANSGGGAGVGKPSGDGSPGKGGSGNSGKGTGGLSRFFYAHRGGNGDRPRYADNPKPMYPKEARDKGYEGEVVLRVEVLANGRVGHIEIRKSSGYELLDHSALTAVKQWKFITAKKGDVAISLWVNIPVKFQLQ
jgi:TonB family protein